MAAAVFWARTTRYRGLFFFPARRRRIVNMGSVRIDLTNSIYTLSRYERLVKLPAFAKASAWQGEGKKYDFNLQIENF